MLPDGDDVGRHALERTWKRQGSLKKVGEKANVLDKIVQNWQRRLSGIVGGGGGPSAGFSGGYILAVLLLVAWSLTGLYRVDEAERGIVQRFGAYTVTTLPGLHWHFPYPTETVDIVNTNEVNNYPLRCSAQKLHRCC